MSDEKKPLVRRIFVSRLLKGGVKSLPWLGGVIEEMIWGTLDDEAAEAEAKWIRGVLSEIAEDVAEQEITSKDVLSRVRESKDIAEKTREKIDQLIEALDRPEQALPSEVERAIDGLLNKHAGRLQAATGDLEGLVARIEEALEKVPATPPGSGQVVTGTGKEVDRLELIEALTGLTEGQLSLVVQAIKGAARNVTGKANVNDRVAELVGWAESGTGPGLAEVYRVACKVIPNFQ